MDAVEDCGTAMQCRACLSTNSTEYVDMGSTMTPGYSILDCFNICTNLKAHYADELPVIICTGCSHDLQIAFKFVQAAFQADVVLRENLGAHKAEVFKDEQTEIECLEYVEGAENIMETFADDAEEQVLEVHYEEKEKKVDLVGDDYKPIDYGEIEMLDEHVMDEASVEFLDVKPQVEHLDVNIIADAADSKCSLKANTQGTPESYPEDEIDDEYMLGLADGMATTTEGWKCFECKRVLHPDVSYEGHLNVHKNIKPYKCTQCRSTFRCKNALEQHTSKRHNHTKAAQKCIACDLCGKLFRLSTLLLEHRRTEHKTLESCSRCGKSFQSTEALDEHMTLIHPPTNTTLIKCPYCEQPPLIKIRLVEHLRLQHPIEYRKHMHSVGRPCDENKVTPWQCEECFRYYRTEALLRDHRNTHNNERPHACGVCEKRFSTANNLRSHMRSAHYAEYEKRIADSLDTVVQCEICKRKLLQKNLEKHLLTHERKDKQTAEGVTAKYLCAYCPRECKSQKAFNHHMKLHQPQEYGIIYECDECERHYPSQQHLEQHRKQAHKERDHVCHICGNAFKLKNQLMNHMKLHLEKNIACPRCDKKYARPFDLNIHMRSHTGEQPFACHLCDKRFAIKVRLTYHLQKHLGIKHRCKECGCEFNSKQKLKAHSYKHIGMPYRCEPCENHGFANRDVFKRHLLRVHNSVMSDEELVEMFQRNTGKTTRIRTINEITTATTVPAEEINVGTEEEVLTFNSEFGTIEELV